MGPTKVLMVYHFANRYYPWMILNRHDLWINIWLDWFSTNYKIKHTNMSIIHQQRHRHSKNDNLVSGQFVTEKKFATVNLSPATVCPQKQFPQTTKLQKVSKCEVKAWLCLTLIILLPLLFCLKSHFGLFKRSKNVIYTNFRDAEFWILVNLGLESCSNLLKIKIQDL